jgi:alkylation response protein AidB-like acyl-CoA dehydrogenase
MISYVAPIADMRFVLEELCGLERTAELPGLEEATPDLVAAVLEEAGKLAGEVLAPINRSGDQQGARFVEGRVRTPEGWSTAYRSFSEGGWNGAVFAPDYGGLGLPWLVNAPVQEMIQGANMAFSLCPLLTQCAIEAIASNGSEELKQRFLPRMISGEWTGTMNLTEAQAGSDLSAVRCKAEPRGDHYLIRGQKIFITYGEHDLTDNIVHLVLARTPGAPPGVKGISLFVVPKILVQADGSLGAANDLRCVALEHKLGVNGSPTAVLAFGDGGGAVGHLVGEENRGLEYMFVMMNLARLMVGIQGLGIAERAYQQALAYARERVQGRPLGSEGDGANLPILHHPDVRRMLMTMKAEIEAMRAVAYATARAIDYAQRARDPEVRARHQARFDLLTPIAKGWCTELGFEIASLGVQIHGGMGYIEETGAAQHLRDARITTIYEGTTGIQAGDLVGRKIIRDKGAAIGELIAEMRALDDKLASNRAADLAVLRQALSDGLDALEEVVAWLLAKAEEDPRLPGAASMSTLQLCGIVFGGYQLARAAIAARRRLAAGEGDVGFLEAKLATARFYAEQEMPKVQALRAAAVKGSASVFGLDEAQF